MDILVDILGGLNPITIFSLLCLTAFLISLYLVFIVLNRNKKIKDLTASLDRLTHSFNNLDEQAKLIVKTDLELNKAQEELDKRLIGLNALQKISRQITTTLDANEIFNRLDKSLAADLGFERILILMVDENKGLRCRLQIGFSKEFTDQTIVHLAKEPSLLNDLKEGHPFSSLTSTKQHKEKISSLFGIEHFLLNPILTQDGFIGLLFIGNRSPEALITEGDEELISILANQIGQSLENTLLFEQVYRSHQELEFKVQERTKQLASALEEVQRISKNKSDFVSAVSHELRTPLTSIKGYASILMTGKIGDIPPQVKDRLEKINKHSDNLVKFINDLLDISRIESGRVEMKLIQHNVPSLIDNIRDLLTPQMKDKNIQFKAEIPGDISDLFVDISQVERVFINLLSNAVKFTPLGGTIAISAQPQNDFILFEISDTGIGIKEEDVPKLFNQFYRIDNEVNRNVKGTGLGLSLVKNIVEAHKGKIWVTSKVNGGTTFHFTLPIVNEKAMP